MTTRTIPKVGQRVIARDAFNELRKATVSQVPRDWRDASHDPAYTTRGDFPKCWLQFDDTGSIVPWPYEDVFSDLADAKEAQRANA